MDALQQSAIPDVFQSKIPVHPPKHVRKAAQAVQANAARHLEVLSQGAKDVTGPSCARVIGRAVANCPNCEVRAVRELHVTQCQGRCCGTCDQTLGCNEATYLNSEEDAWRSARGSADQRLRYGQKETSLPRCVQGHSR